MKLVPPSNQKVIYCQFKIPKKSSSLFLLSYFHAGGYSDRNKVLCFIFQDVKAPSVRAAFSLCGPRSKALKCYESHGAMTWSIATENSSRGQDFFNCMGSPADASIY